MALLALFSCALATWHVPALLAQGEMPQTQPGFPPNSTFATTGVDHINLFNGNLVVTIPIGPHYPIGVGLTQQFQLVYNSQLWRPDQACQDYTFSFYYYGLHVTGSPILGAGASLHFGYIRYGRPGTPATGGEYIGPDGSVHNLYNYRSTDTTYLRVRDRIFSGGHEVSAVIDFPNGDTGTFTQPITEAGVQHGAAPQDFYASGLYLTKLANRYGDYYQVNYETVGGVVRIASVQHFSQGVLLRTIGLYYSTLTVDTRPRGGTGVDSWTVLDHIDFPTLGGAAQRVRFSYYAEGFERTSGDGTRIQCSSPQWPPETRSPPQVAGPLLRRVQLEDSEPSLAYEFDYIRALDPSLGAASGVMKELRLPAGGAIRYEWIGVPPDGRQKEPKGFYPCPTEDTQCYLGFYRENTVEVTRRTEFPDGLAGPSFAWGYEQQILVTNPPENRFYQTTGVTAPDGNRVVHYFHLNPVQLEAFSTGQEYLTEYLDAGGAIRRTESFCHESDGHAMICGPSLEYYYLGDNIRRAREDVTVVGSPSHTRRVQRTNWDGFGHWGREDTYEWDSLSVPLRSVVTQWNPDTTGWMLNLYTRRTETEGATSRDQYFYFDVPTGFLFGTVIWDSGAPPPGRVLGTCRFASGDGTTTDGTVKQEVTATATHGQPLTNPCPGFGGIYPRYGSFSAWPPGIIGVNHDAFGKWNEYRNGLSTTSRWIQSLSPISWYSTRQARDDWTGLVTASFDTAGLETDISYDLLGRTKRISPPGEAPTDVTYDSPNQVTVTRSDVSGQLTWQRQIYDGFGRLTREIRKMPGTPPAYGLRLRKYDAMGRTYFLSEWAACSSEAGCANLDLQSWMGTTSSSFDPFGRPRTITGADGAVTDISYADSPDPFPDMQNFSEVQKSVRVNNLGGTCINFSCSGGVSATTIYRYDVLGRLISVTEPGGIDVTSYSYDVNGKLTQVSQGDQPRTFVYDPFGFLRSETTPEGGRVTYDDYGSLGNVRQEKAQSDSPDGILRLRCYDFAGRLLLLRTNEDGAPNCSTEPGQAAGRTYLQNGYDENPSAFNFSSGKLTKRVGTSYEVLPPSQSTNVLGTVTDTWTYGGLGGRPSSRQTAVSAAQSLTATQGWQYNSLGLLAHHSHPRYGSLAPFVVSLDYDAGMPTTEYVNGIPMVSAVGYQPSGALAAYTTGAGIQNVTTTITPDGSLPRPSNISTDRVSTNLLTWIYSYDGAGNIVRVDPDTFTYDSRSRLMSATLPGEGSQTFTYDRYGNMIAKTGPPWTVAFCSETCVNNRLPFSAAEYDVRGNLKLNKLDGGEIYTWDGLDRMSYNHSPINSSYVYDGANERVAKNSGAGWSFTLRDEQERLATVFTSSGLPDTDNVYLGNQLVASYAATSTRNWSFYTADHLGTPRLLTDITGNAFETRKYWPYGETVYYTNSGLESLRFAGMERDVESSGRYYDHARSHDANLSRFLSADSVVDMKVVMKDPQGWNRYSYVRSSPLNRTDPTGRCEDPGKGEGGTRICIQPFIPTRSFGIFRGDNRQAQSDGGTFRASQTLTLTEGGHGATKQAFTPGISVSGPFSAKAAVSEHDVKGTPNGVNVKLKASDGLFFGAAPNLSYDLTLMPKADGDIKVAGTHSAYPALEVWMYRDGHDPQLLYNYKPASTNFFGGTRDITQAVTIPQDKP